jgi:hypothetical protein
MCRDGIFIENEFTNLFTTSKYNLDAKSLRTLAITAKIDENKAWKEETKTQGTLVWSSTAKSLEEQRDNRRESKVWQEATKT